jgi:hypothetical protein
MAIGHVVTRGYGTGSFDGEIRQAVLRGFFDSIVVPLLVDQVPNLSFRPNTGSFQIPLEGYFAGETGFSATGLATGITLNTGTGVLTVNTATASTTNGIVVTATNGAGSTAGNSFNVKISSASTPPRFGIGNGSLVGFRVRF